MINIYTFRQISKILENIFIISIICIATVNVQNEDIRSQTEVV